MRSYLVSDAVLCGIIMTSLIIGILIGSFSGHILKSGSENSSLIKLHGEFAPNIEGENNSFVVNKNKNSSKNITTIPTKTPEPDISIFDKNDFKHIFTVNTYYNKGANVFKDYHWTDIIGILGGGFLNVTKEPDCGEKAAFAEWLLRRHGINASIVAADNFAGMGCPHAWVKVKTPMDEIFVDMSRGSGGKNGNDTGYIKNSDDYKHFDEEFKDVFQAESDYSDSCSKCKNHFGWWETDWGKFKLKDLGFFDNETITVTGSATVFSLLDAEAKAFNAKHGGCKVIVNGGSNSECIAAIAENISDVALTSREVNDDEKEKYGSNFRQFNIGLNGTIVVVSKSIYQAGINSLTTEQLRKIYAGVIRNWKDVGGPDRSIHVIAGKNGRNRFNRIILGSTNAEALGVSIGPENDTEVKTSVNSSDQAIGYIDYEDIEKGNISVLAIDGVLPTLQNFKNESYKLSPPSIYLYTYVEPDQGVQKFVNFLNSPEGQNIMAMYSNYLYINKIIA